MAATLIPSIPLALLYNVFLDRFIAGLHRRGIPLFAGNHARTEDREWRKTSEQP